MGNLFDIIFSKQTPVLYGWAEKNIPVDGGILNNPDLTGSQKAEFINAIGNTKRGLYQEEFGRNIADKIIGAGLQFGSAFFPGYKGGQIVQKLYSGLAPKLGRKIARNIAENAAKGAIGTGLYSFGDGLLNDSNPYLEGLKGAGIGFTGGAGLSGIGGYYEKFNRGAQLSKFVNPDFMRKAELKNFRKTGKKYYQDYIQGTSLNHPELGNIGFTGKGIDEIGFRYPNAIRMLPQLKNNLKNARFLETQSPYHKRYDRIDNFHILEDNKYIYNIGQDKGVNKIFYSLKENPGQFNVNNNFIKQLQYK